ncbi:MULTISPECIES: short-chain dehydrogenase [unclassified Exiguobacterium]|uniref:short-chain dehydrogenase n=1 Tax=unclassified Exiguobacterium TaxID=2644629 RepID=UPI00103D7E83|nr:MULTISPECIES: short-chain dehydrogenase [unclassified Exiguobacterium]TCI35702.1 short-chain dehydrogenase [Exiguobacterium sp. SH4S7]TCI65221.1 short-chain dehydrogenase [Exiguobacterium sp. SH0S2]
MKHALVIGGSGMLRETVLWLADVGYHVSVIGRDEAKMGQLIPRRPDRLSAIYVDYHDSVQMADSVRQAIAERGAIDLVVAWIHSDAPDALPCVLREVRHDAQLFHVLGSRAHLEDVKSRLVLPDKLRYHQVQLGHITEHGARRWLTHEEIAGGVIMAIQENKLCHIVGVVD